MVVCEAILSALCMTNWILKKKKTYMYIGWPRGVKKANNIGVIKCVKDKDKDKDRDKDKNINLI